MDGVRWRVRKRTFAHVLTVEGGADSAHARAVGHAWARRRSSRSAPPGPSWRCSASAGHPFFYAGWGRDVVGMVLDAATDWARSASCSPRATACWRRRSWWRSSTDRADYSTLAKS